MLLAAVALIDAGLIYASKWASPVIKATDGKNVTETHFARAGK